jgi:hypothetical protein
MPVILATLFVEVAHRGFYAPICRRSLTLRHLWSANRSEEQDMSFLIWIWILGGSAVAVVYLLRKE